MIKSTASAGPVEITASSVSPSAYYLWEFPEKPVSVRLSLDVVDRLERDVLESFRAITARGSEVGGLLLGRSEAGAVTNTIIENYELFHCDYTRGPLFLLSEEEKRRLEELIRRKKSISGQSGAVVGFFRSNTRKDLSLDDEDLDIFRSHFSRPEQAFLLVKPYAAKASMAGFFIWEGSRVQSEGSYIEFPFRRSELGKGHFAKSIVLDAPKPKEIETPAAPASADKKGARAQVLPFSLRRDEEPPVPAPPLKKEERPAVLSLAPKVEELPLEPNVEEVAKPAGKKPAEEAPAARKEVDKQSPELPPLREDKKESRREVKKEEKKEAVRKEAAPLVEVPAARSAAKEIHEKNESRETKAEPVLAEPKFESLPARSRLGGKKIWALFGGLTMLTLAGVTAYHLKTKSATSATVSVGEGGFQLRAERSNGQLLVSWNRQSEMIQKAQSAVLSISDGAKTEDVALDLAQLRAGSIMYAPLSSDVSFRLEVKAGAAGTSRSETVRILGNQSQDPAGTSANPQASPKLAAQQAHLATPPQQMQPQAGQSNPAPAEASRVDSNPVEAAQAARPTPEPKPFSLAARIHQPEATDLPEAPSVDPSGSSAVPIRPSVPGRLPAPPPPVAPPPQPQPQAAPPSAAPAVAAPAQPPANVRIGGKVQEPKLLRRVDAAYPPMARQARVSGVVRIQATIGKDGKVKKVEVKSGPPLLRQAALDAVQKWVYSPSLLNGAPVEATTDVDVSFNLTAR